MFNLFGSIISLLIICVVVVTLLQLLKKVPFIVLIENWFIKNIKRVSFYQILSFLLSFIILWLSGAVLGWTSILSGWQLILNALIVTFSANGVYTWYIKIFNIVKPLVSKK